MRHSASFSAALFLLGAALFGAGCDNSGSVAAPGPTRDGGSVADGGRSDADGGGSGGDGGGLALDGGGVRADGGSVADGGVLSDGGGVAANTSAVTFIVRVPSGTPYYEGVFISGSGAALGTWNGRGSALAPRTDGRWSVTLALPTSAATEYKMTRGSWDTVEKDSAGNELANRSVTPNGATSVELLVAHWRDTPSVTGRIESLGSFHSQLLPDDRPVLVYLPPGYDPQAATRYPVLYLHDGQNVFDARSSFGGVEWRADEAAEGLINTHQIAPLIMVAVGNTSARIDEYTPIRDASERAGGKAELYARLLVEELKPRIDATYRTKPEAQFTGVAGSSLGGLVSMYIGLTRSSTFTRIGVTSPSVWWANRDIITRVNALAQKPPLRIWEDIGTAEGGSTVTDAQALRTALVNKGFVLEADLKYREYGGASHDESSWAARFADVLKYLYPPQ